MLEVGINYQKLYFWIALIIVLNFNLEPSIQCLLFRIENDGMANLLVDMGRGYVWISVLVPLLRHVIRTTLNAMIMKIKKVPTKVKWEK